jgi:macrolide transport system ATP-binding/permease protein
VFVPGTNIGKDINVKHNVIGNGYFATMQIPLLAGRNFSTSDTSTSQHVAIISEHLAKILFPLGNPIGRHYGLDGDKPEAISL